ncbi:uncharacterized protein [Physcomitrium patens]|uniref:COMM domain-containing protein n=1 Tax=Physcomitrium patens TaxID=3218 RepID=A0A2K1JGM7_PHYPA|nr:COMM domain-containing protein 2-like [Physcomitrium patens]PNR40669.1 hypothetical protein PHYPA_018072 [Physcomitrium patens]|eukprot:XP_024394901.1 COMM domain-containing protein 2-like [Physcomitrella patens]
MAHQVQVPEFLLGADLAVSQEFAKIALDRIVKSEAGTRGFAKAARVLQVTVEDVEQAVAALTTLYARAVRLQLQHAELLTIFSDAGFEEATGAVLADMFTQRHQELFGVVALNGTSFSRLDWRLDIQVASRSLRQQATPRYLLALKTTDGVKHIEADYSVLKDVCLQLEAALAESRSTRSRRFLRVFR